MHHDFQVEVADAHAVARATGAQQRRQTRPQHPFQGGMQLVCAELA
jgi:hypothetical protein